MHGVNLQRVWAGLGTSQGLQVLTCTEGNAASDWLTA